LSKPDRLSVTLDKNAHTTALVYLASDDVRMGATLVLAHGAGAPQQSKFMVDYARGLSARGVDVVTFNFLYTEQKRRVPDRTPALEACYRAVVDVAKSHAPLKGNPIFIGGKSMGGRMATHLAATGDAGISGVVLLGYPLHPPGKPDQLRAAHLAEIRVPMLFVQGERDTFGTPADLQPILDRLKTDVTLHAVERGDHSLAPSRRADVIAATYAGIQDVIAVWIRRHGAVRA
jgi:predicted alpha/beta-hydrolase family hydrolase